jgi:hypothetical protein
MGQYQNVIDSYTDVQVKSQTDTRKVQVAEFETIKYGVRAQRAIPYDQWISDPAHLELDQTAQAIEQPIDSGLAVAAQGVEDLDAFGLTVYLIEYLVQAPAPNPLANPLTATVLIPIDSLTFDVGFGSFLQGGTPTEALKAAYDALVTTGQQ